MRKRLRRTLAEVLPSEVAHKFYNSFDIIGDIAIIKLPCNASEKAQLVAKTIMSIHRNVENGITSNRPVAAI